MKKIIFFLAAWGMAAGLSAQLTEWRDPQVPEVNREYPVTGFMSYTSRESAAKNDYTVSPYFQPLDGVWKHKRFESTAELRAEVFAADFSVSGWADVTIPQKNADNPVQEKGMGIPGDVSVDVFRREFHMPFAWVDKQVFIEIGEARSGVSVFVNGQPAGYAEDEKAPAVFDITTLVKEGNNTLAIAATGWSTGSQFERDDRMYGQIAGNVCIKTLPRVRVRDFEIRTDLTDNYRNGALDFGVVVKSHLLNPKEVRVYFELFSPEGQLLKTEYKDVALRMRQEQMVHFDALVPDVKAWSSESPTLYTVMIRIQREGRYTEYIERKVGFRSVENIEGKLLVNGKPVTLNGKNITDFPSDPTEMERAFHDLKLNINHYNAVRVMHGLQPARFYELCDRYGFYVLSEANIDSRTYGTAPETTLGNNPAYLNAHIDRVKTAYERTKNYASVILFSLGDQGGNGYNFYEAYLWMKSREKTHPVIYAGAGREWNSDVLDFGGLCENGTEK